MFVFFWGMLTRWCEAIRAMIVPLNRKSLQYIKSDGGGMLRCGGTTVPHAQSAFDSRAGMAHGPAPPSHQFQLPTNQPTTAMDIHTPSVPTALPNGTSSSSSGDPRADLLALISRKDAVEEELKALGAVLESVSSYLQLIPLLRYATGSSLIRRPLQ